MTAYVVFDADGNEDKRGHCQIENLEAFRSSPLHSIFAVDQSVLDQSLILKLIDGEIVPA